MKTRVLTFLSLLIVVLACPASAQLDLGAPDTVAMEVTISPCAATSQLNVQMDLFVFNDSNTMMGLSVGFTWDNPNLHLDSTKAHPVVTANLDQVFLVDGDISKTNDLKHFLFGGLSFFDGVPPDSVRRPWASYYFSLDSWTQTDIINFDTLEYDGGTNFVAIDRGTTLEYVPVWAGGNSPITITDCDDVKRRAWFVAVDGDDQYGDGSPENPFATIQHAIDMAIDEDVVLVMPGTYSGEGNMEVDFSGKLIHVRSDAGPESTIIDCMGAGNGFRFESAETSAAVLQGFTVRNGNDGEGGALVIHNSCPSIHDCVFEDNRGFMAGAVHILNATGEVQFTNCRFENNRADLLGGAIYSRLGPVSFSECVMAGNSAAVGGAMVIEQAPLVVDHCTLVGNDADGTSAITIPIFHAEPVTITNSIIAFTIDGTALTCTDSSNFHLSCNDFYGNDGGDWVNCLADELGQNGNFEADPLFCDLEGADYGLKATSPCAPGAQPGCDLIGALPVGCPVAGVPRAWYVSVDGNDETGDGDPDNPFATVQRGIDECSLGDTVLVTPGTYTGPGNRQVSFQLKNISLMSLEGPQETILDGEGVGPILFIPGLQMTNPVIDGLTLRNGHCHAGGAIRAFGSNPTLVNCVFNQNSASYGGAIYFNGNEDEPADNTPRDNPDLSQSNPTLTVQNCTFTGNIANNRGSVIYWQYNGASVNFENCIMFGNEAYADAPVSGFQVNISCCDIFGNSPEDWGSPIAHLADTLGNFSADPLFCNLETSDYRLSQTSPCAPANNDCGLLVGALPVGCHGLSQNIWYVAEYGDDFMGNGSFDNPFATIQHAIEQSADGDSVRVLPGVYFESLNYGGRLIVVHAVEGPLVTTITNERRTNLVMFDHGEDASAVLEGFTLEGGWMAILCSNSGPTIRHNIIRDQNVTNWAAVALAGVTGVNYDPNGDPRYTATYGPSPAQIINNTIAFSANGGISSFSTEAPTIKNTIIAFNSNYGFHQQSTTGHPQPLLSYNDVFGNPFAYHNIIDVGVGTISADPKFASDLTLVAGSPCIDAGDPNPAFNDPDGSRNDMGAVPGEGGQEVIPTDMWINIYCGMAFLDRGYLPAGAVIRAYDPNGVLCGKGIVRDDHSYGFIPIYHDDIYSDADEGAVVGDHISFTVNGEPVVGNVKVVWTENGDSYELCQFFTQRCCTITGGTGWTLVSWNVAYADDIDNFVDGHTDCFDVILSFEQGGLTYDPALPEFSTLQKVDYHHGYWIRDHCSYLVEPRRDICGMPIPTSESISLEAGWNVVAYWPGQPLPTEAALANVMDKLLVATGFEYGAMVYMPDGNGFNTLNEMKPGLGYWVKSDSPTLLNYPGFGLADSVPVPYNTGLAVHRIENAGQAAIASRQWINAYGKDITLDGAPLKAGDQIDFYTEAGVLCGSSHYGDGLLKFTPIYGKDESAAFSREYPGPGDRIEVRVNGVRVLPDLVWEGDFVRVAMGSLATSSEELIPDRFVLAQNYPNPFNPGTTIKYGLPAAGDVRLTIYNVLGQTVRTLVSGHTEAGQHEAYWDGVDDQGQAVSSGVYLYRLDATGFSQTRKMILMK